MTDLKVYLAILGMVAVVSLGVAYEIAVWNECRETNSWFYCMRLLSR